MRTVHRMPASLALAGVLMIAAPACAPVGGLLGDSGSYPGGRTAVMNGEIRSVDTRRGQLQIREDRSNRNHTVRYDNRTRVTYAQRQYPASSLQRGDIVRVSISHDRSGAQWADRVEVRSSARNARSDARVQRVDGTVGVIDHRRGYFALHQNRAGTVVVYLPPRLNNNEVRRFDRLRRGDRVRVDVRPSGNNQAELVRFR